MRKGGAAIDRRNLYIWIAITVGILLALCVKLNQIKTNYTDLHRRVHQLEYKYD